MWPTAHRGPRSPPADARGVPAVQGPRPGRGATAPKARARQGARIGGRRLAETCRLIADRRLDLHCTAVFRRVPESYIAFIEEFPVGTRRRSDWGEFQRRLYPHLAGRGNSRALPGRALVERLVEFLHLGTQLLLGPTGSATGRGSLRCAPLHPARSHAACPRGVGQAPHRGRSARRC